jgi:hypothetical protein
LAKWFIGRKKTAKGTACIKYGLERMRNFFNEILDGPDFTKMFVFPIYFDPVFFFVIEIGIVGYF